MLGQFTSMCVCLIPQSVRSSRCPHRASVLTQKYIIISAERGWETKGSKTGVCKDTGEARALPLSHSWLLSFRVSILVCNDPLLLLLQSLHVFSLLSGRLACGSAVCSVLSDGQLIAPVFVDL